MTSKCSALHVILQKRGGHKREDSLWQTQHVWRTEGWIESWAKSFLIPRFKSETMKRLNSNCSQIEDLGIFLNIVFRKEFIYWQWLEFHSQTVLQCNLKLIYQHKGEGAAELAVACNGLGGTTSKNENGRSIPADLGDAETGPQAVQGDSPYRVRCGSPMKICLCTSFIFAHLEFRILPYQCTRDCLYS